MRRFSALITAMAVLTGLLALLGALWMPLLPNAVGHVGADYAFWLPNLLAGYFWYLHNGILSLPWFSPAECAGEPFQADPQIGYLSLPQILSFATDPLSAVRICFIVYAAAGFAGAWALARRSFGLAAAPALVCACLFALNGFFPARMAVGHLSFAPFMLLPAFCAALLPPPGAPRLRAPSIILRGLLAGAVLAVVLQAGMAVLVPQFLLSAVAVALLQACRFAPRRAVPASLAVALASAFAVSAGKLTATAALLANFPRAEYSLPGIAGLPGAVWVALRSLFWPFTNDLTDWVTNTPIIQDPHEFAYGVGLAVPLLLAACGLVAVRRGGWRALRPRSAACLALIAVLAVPLAVNIYAPGWNAFLKSLPVLNNSSTALRWFAVWMLPCCVGAALCVAALAQAWRGREAVIAAAAIAVTALGAAGADRSSYGADRLGIYDPSDIVAAWHRAHDAGAPIAVRAVAQLFGADHRPVMIPDRQNGMAHGFSTLGCYDPLFGYRLERLPVGQQRLGPAMAEIGGKLNFKNPACYVFPAANACRPGDQFDAAQADQLARFLDYRSYAFREPLSAVLAGWLSLLSAIFLPVVALICARRARRG